MVTARNSNSSERYRRSSSLMGRCSEHAATGVPAPRRRIAMNFAAAGSAITMQCIAGIGS
jgi:hypothetical protein